MCLKWQSTFHCTIFLWFKIPEFPKLPAGVQAWRVCRHNSEQKEEFVSFKWLICSFLIWEVSLTKCYVTQRPSRRLFKGVLTSFVPSLNLCWWGPLFSAMYLLFVSYKQGSTMTGCLGEMSKKVSFIPLESFTCFVHLYRQLWWSASEHFELT